MAEYTINSNYSSSNNNNYYYYYYYYYYDCYLIFQSISGDYSRFCRVS